MIKQLQASASFQPAPLPSFPAFQLALGFLLLLALFKTLTLGYSWLLPQFSTQTQGGVHKVRMGPGWLVQSGPGNQELYSPFLSFFNI